MYLSSAWVRRHVIPLAIRHPGAAAGLVFFFLFTVSNHVEFATGMALRISPYWRILVTGALFALFGAALLYEIIRLHRQLAEVRMVRAVASTLHHEINNPLTVIQFSAEKMLRLRTYDEPSLTDIINHNTRIRDVVVRLTDLDQEVRLRFEPGFEGLIDLVRSR
jgi:signal transduction histidine kinase